MFSKQRTIEDRTNGPEPINCRDPWEGHFVCKEEVDAYLETDTIHCLLCWKSGIHKLDPHLRTLHGISVYAYKERFRIPSHRGLCGRLHAAKFAVRGRRIGRVSKAPLPNWDTFLERVRGGAFVSRILGEPGMPTQGQYNARRGRDREFDYKMRGLLESRRGAPLRYETIETIREEMAKGRHPDEIGQALGLTKHISKTLRNMRRASPVIAAKFASVWCSVDKNAERRQKAVDWEGFATRVAAGESMSSIYRAGVLGATCDAWLTQKRRNPEFAARIAEIKAGLQRTVLPRTLISADESLERYNTALRSNNIYALVDAAVPRHLPAHMREDVTSEVIVSLFDGEIREADIARAVRRRIAEYNRMFSSRDRSFDEAVGEGGLKFGGLIADPNAFSIDGMYAGGIIQPSAW